MYFQKEHQCLYYFQKVFFSVLKELFGAFSFEITNELLNAASINTNQDLYKVSINASAFSYSNIFSLYPIKKTLSESLRLLIKSFKCSCSSPFPKISRSKFIFFSENF